MSGLCQTSSMSPRINVSAIRRLRQSLFPKELASIRSPLSVIRLATPKNQAERGGITEGPKRRTCRNGPEPTRSKSASSEVAFATRAPTGWIDGGWIDGGWIDGGWIDGGWTDGGWDGWTEIRLVPAAIGLLVQTPLVLQAGPSAAPRGVRPFKVELTNSLATSIIASPRAWALRWSLDFDGLGTKHRAFDSRALGVPVYRNPVPRESACLGNRLVCEYRLAWGKTGPGRHLTTVGGSPSVLNQRESVPAQKQCIFSLRSPQTLQPVGNLRRSRWVYRRQVRQKG
ncbi:hypothetical protein Pla22_16900 [Rubripirellula amarantea]|uniref:Uncharacterized protein n=1 Tax=Rubripirellula amarantea TaxID=2527999 RepID=A0A5C5WVT8_9BACT|nr:hypothetical protein Pla22_16900 [Rubripirellula amarantea]